MNIKDEITTAINDKLTLIVNYKNEPLNRTIEPHSLGTKNNNFLLSAFQTTGYSTSNKNSNVWKSFDIKYLKIISKSKPFIPRFNNGYNPLGLSSIFDTIIITAQ